MIDLEVSSVIQRPLEEVFAFVANFENNPKWESNFEKVKLLKSTPEGVGTLYECELQLPGQAARSVFTITEYQPNQKIAFVGEATGPAKAVGSYRFESVADGTKITLIPRPEFRGMFKLLEPLMKGYIRKQNEEHLAVLKRLLEAEEAPLPR